MWKILVCCLHYRECLFRMSTETLSLLKKIFLDFFNTGV
nr:MAG TPA: hypothetical protein [Caudoviricetes sp.]